MASNFGIFFQIKYYGLYFCLIRDILDCMVVDWTKICKKYKGLWVGLRDDEKTVVADGKTVKEVMEKAEQRGYAKPILFRVPTKIIPYVGGFGR